MIRVIHGHERSMFPREIDQMHRLRKKVFYDRMNWDVPVINTWEADGFDALDPVYLLKMDEGALPRAIDKMLQCRQGYEV